MSTHKNDKVGWMSLPKKDQLFVLCLMRFAEPVVSASLGVSVYRFLPGLCLDNSVHSLKKKNVDVHVLPTTVPGSKSVIG